jgi:hypothetical protein
MTSAAVAKLTLLTNPTARVALEANKIAGPKTNILKLDPRMIPIVVLKRMMANIAAAPLLKGGTEPNRLSAL